MRRISQRLIGQWMDASLCTSLQLRALGGTSVDRPDAAVAQAHEARDLAPGLALLAQAGDASLPCEAGARCLLPTRWRERCVRDGRRGPFPDCPPLQCGLIGGPTPVGSARDGGVKPAPPLAFLGPD